MCLQFSTKRAACQGASGVFPIFNIILASVDYEIFANAQNNFRILHFPTAAPEDSRGNFIAIFHYKWLKRRENV